MLNRLYRIQFTILSIICICLEKPHPPPYVLKNIGVVVVVTLVVVVFVVFVVFVVAVIVFVVIFMTFIRQVIG